MPKRLVLKNTWPPQRAWRYLLLCLSVILGVSGGILWGQGAYLYAKAHLGQYLIVRAWRLSGVKDTAFKPWPWADTWPVARLRIPGLGLDQVVLAGDSGQALAFGPGHTSASALPGEPGTVLISGHRDTHFQALKHLEVNERITLEDPYGRVHAYRVEALRVVPASTEVGFDVGASRLVLATCWPFDGIAGEASERYLVEALAIEPRVESSREGLAMVKQIDLQARYSPLQGQANLLVAIQIFTKVFGSIVRVI